ncbi:hypothetical protein ASF61_22270 [Duganella sp. Leaf126]|uniref:hypothetical protein n=1 Tax=Duganella sp. Leaf126 TaxID=1736266 RepID=UPI000714D6FB|nr:hypothetical protein [Duganella sp. Leaf126]KQQ39189.1 hypothetical protein ASF61_22270 [Duganella sp. Leaf126]
MGVKVSIDVQAEVQWLNPEGEKSDGTPVTVKPGDAIGEYKTMAKVGYGASASAGAGIKGAFKIGIEKGNFVIKAKVGACWGLGGEGSFSGEVGYETIGEFFKFVSYQLKRADFHKIGDFIEKEAYDYYCQIYYLVVAKGKELKGYVNQIGEKITQEYEDFKDTLDEAIEAGAQEVEGFLNRLNTELNKKTSSWFSYSPPEVVGQIQRQLAMVALSANSTFNERAPRLMAMSLGAPQTLNQLSTIAERMTAQMGDKQSASQGFAMIRQSLSGSIYATDLEATEQRLASAQPMSSKPFIWNHEPEFVAARLSIEDAMYT